MRCTTIRECVLSDPAVAMPAVSPTLMIATALVMFGAASAAQATVHDAVADFSTTTNTETSQWSYRTATAGGPDVLLPNFGPFAGFTGPAAGTAGWAQSGVPAVGLNTTGVDQYFIGFGPGAQFTWPAGALFMHPGPASLVLVSWRSPAAALLSISAQFADMDANPAFSDGVSWSVEKNNRAGVLASGSFANGGASGMVQLSQIRVEAGDRIQFVVGGNTDFQGDSTRLMATITAAPVPEPATWLLALVGGAVLLGWRRRA